MSETPERHRTRRVMGHVDEAHLATMPPLPSTLDATTQNLVEALARRERDLREFQIPRLRTCDGPLATQQQYAAEIREDLDGFGKQVEVSCGLLLCISLEA